LLNQPKGHCLLSVHLKIKIFNIQEFYYFFPKVFLIIKKFISATCISSKIGKTTHHTILNTPVEDARNHHL